MLSPLILPFMHRILRCEMGEKVLILGAGKIAGPLINYFLMRNYEVTIATEYCFQAEYLLQNHPKGKAVQWVVNDLSTLYSLARQNDIIISILPHQLHPLICKTCINAQKNLVTPSYLHPDMEKLHQEAIRNNLTIITEAGFSPGLDHMWCKEITDNIHNAGGRVTKLISVGGSLPAPESLDNPFRYKFSWSPEEVIESTIAKASFLRKNAETSYEHTELLSNTIPIQIDEIENLEAHALKNSINYIEHYELTDAVTFIRGTLRYKGWAETMHSLYLLGFFSKEEIPATIKTYAQLTTYLTNTDKANLRERIAELLNINTHSNSLQALEWIGLFSSMPLSKDLKTPLQIITHRLSGKLKLLPSDKDMVALKILIEYWDDKNSKKYKAASLLHYGSDNEKTAIAKAVSIPLALTADLLLKGKIRQKGITRPVSKEIYQPIMKQLRQEFKFKFKETDMADIDWPTDW